MDRSEGRVDFEVGIHRGPKALAASIRTLE